MEHYICVNFFIPDTSSVRNVDIRTFLHAATPLPKIETEDYLQQSIGDILSILSKKNNQPPLLTYGETKTSKFESIANILQRAIPRAPPFILNPYPTPTPEHTIPVTEQAPINVTTIIHNTPPVLIQVQRGTTINPNMPISQVQRVALKYPGGTTIPTRKALPLRYA